MPPKPPPKPARRKSPTYGVGFAKYAAGAHDASTAQDLRNTAFRATVTRRAQAKPPTLPPMPWDQPKEPTE